jgi:polar amino acid transport system permease protein
VRKRPASLFGRLAGRLEAALAAGLGKIPLPWRGVVVFAGITLFVTVSLWASLLVVRFVLSAQGDLAIGSRAVQTAAPLFGRAAGVTLLLTGVAGAAGLVLGVLAGAARSSALLPARAIAGFYVWFIRGTPLLVQILFAAAVVPAIIPPAPELPWAWLNDALRWMRRDPFFPAVTALALNVGAYNAEAVRAGLIAVPRGQREAARSLGLNPRQTLFLVVIPQAVPVMIPPLVNNLVALLKDSSLAAILSIEEVTLTGQRTSARTFRPLEIWPAVAFTYLVQTTVLTLFTNWLERVMARRGDRSLVGRR